MRAVTLVACAVGVLLSLRARVVHGADACCSGIFGLGGAWDHKEFGCDTVFETTTAEELKCCEKGGGAYCSCPGYDYRPNNAGGGGQCCPGLFLTLVPASGDACTALHARFSWTRYSSWPSKPDGTPVDLDGAIGSRITAQQCGVFNGHLPCHFGSASDRPLSGPTCKNVYPYVATQFLPAAMHTLRAWR